METPALGKGEVMCRWHTLCFQKSPGDQAVSLDDPLSASFCVQDGQLQRWEVRVMQGVGGCTPLDSYSSARERCVSQDQNLSLLWFPSFSPHLKTAATPKISPPPPSPLPLTVPEPRVPLLVATAGNPRPRGISLTPDHSPEPG